MILNYTDKKKILISEIDIEKLKNFIKSLPNNSLALILKKLPKVNGFRPEKEIELKISNYCKRVFKLE